MLFDVERCRFDKARVVDDDGAAAIEHFESVVIKADALRLASIVRENGCYFKTQGKKRQKLYSTTTARIKGAEYDRKQRRVRRAGKCCRAAFELRPHHHRS